MKRELSGMYKETREVMVDGRKIMAEFHCFRIRIENPQKRGDYIESPLWSWTCPKLHIMPSDVFDHKKDALESMEKAVEIGFRTLPVKAMGLAIQSVK